MENNKRIIEINGVKLEVDLSQARVVENFRVGDNVKVLMKRYSDSWESHAGVIAGFDNFKERPTIVVAYLDHYELKFSYINRDSKDVELCLMSRDEAILQKSDLLEQMDRQIASKESEVADLKARKNYFLDRFGKYFDASAAIEKALS